MNYNSLEARKLQLLIIAFFTNGSICIESDIEQAANKVLTRTIGASNASYFELQYVESDKSDFYSIKVENNKVHITGSSATAICRGAYDYLRNNCQSIISWSGNKINIPEQLPQVKKTDCLFTEFLSFQVIRHGIMECAGDESRTTVL